LFAFEDARDHLINGMFMADDRRVYGVLAATGKSR
jgi:hypothetical protein